MTTKRIDWSDALTLIEKAVEERGTEWVYPDTGECRYMYDPYNYEAEFDDSLENPTKLVEAFGEVKQPACLVGLALFSFDPRFEGPLWANNDNSVDGWMGIDADYTVRLDDDDEVVVTQEAIKVLQAAQSAQDTGSSWGIALERARKRVTLGGWDN